jgi:flagellar hook protein FlgE
MSIPASGLTVGGLISAINSAYGGAVATLDSSGNIELTASHTGQSALSLTIADDPANTGGKTSFSPFLETTAGTNGDTNIAFQINNLGGNGAPQSVALNFGTPGSFSGVTQTGSGSSVSATSQDGYAQGTLQSETVNSNGVITGQFSNGKTESIAQIALATFSNPQGLQNAGNNYFTYTTSSGLPTVSAAGTGGAGTIQSGGLEGSNVDVGTEFTQLIAAQQGYEVNAKAFSVANQLMQAAVNLIQG